MACQLNKKWQSNFIQPVNQTKSMTTVIATSGGVTETIQTELSPTEVQTAIEMYSKIDNILTEANNFILDRSNANFKNLLVSVKEAKETAKKGKKAESPL
jgi:hypothetical protein